MKKQFALVLNKSYVNQTDLYIPTKNRNAMVYSLIDSCGLLDKLDLIKPEKATKDQLLLFHCQEYIDFLKQCDKDYNNDADENMQSEFGFGYDCPLKSRIV